MPRVHPAHASVLPRLRRDLAAPYRRPRSAQPCVGQARPLVSRMALCEASGGRQQSLPGAARPTAPAHGARSARLQSTVALKGGPTPGICNSRIRTRAPNAAKHTNQRAQRWVYAEVTKHGAVDGYVQIIKPADLNWVLQVVCKPSDEPGQCKDWFCYLSFNEQYLVQPTVSHGSCICNVSCTLSRLSNDRVIVRSWQQSDTTGRTFRWASGVVAGAHSGATT